MKVNVLLSILSSIKHTTPNVETIELQMLNNFNYTKYLHMGYTVLYKPSTFVQKISLKIGHNQFQESRNRATKLRITI